MTQCWVGDAKFSQECTSSGGLDPQPSLHASLRCSASTLVFGGGGNNWCTVVVISTAEDENFEDATGHLRNVFWLLALREISPCTKNSSKRFWHQNSKAGTDVFGPRCEIVDARRSLASWVEADSLSNLSGKYCPLLPPPRSTIAAAFSSDGKTLASTHGDHTVKIIDCQTGSCLKVLTGHRRTPWVVRFHPLHSEILASGSLDQEVRLWDAHTAACIRSHNFYRPIASIAFHAQGEVLAVASGHKLFMWQYNNRCGESSIAISVLKTKRSLRAVHFHPYAAPLLLTAEVNNLDSPDSPLTLATTPGYPQYPPASFVTNVEHSTHIDDEARMPFMPSPYLFWPTFVGDGGQSLQQFSIEAGTVNWQQRAEFSQQQAYSNMGSHHNDIADPMEVSLEPCSSNIATDIAIDSSFLAGREVATGYSDTGNLVNINGSDAVWSEHRSSAAVIGRMDAVLNGESSIHEITAVNSLTFSSNNEPEMPIRSAYDGHFHQYIPFSDLASWRLPFLQSWVMGQTNVSPNMMPPVDSALQRSTAHGLGSVLVAPDQPLMHSVGTGHRRNAGQNLNHHSLRSHWMVSTERGEASAAELPCTVKLRIWSHDIQVPSAPLDPEKCLLTIPHAVLCSEMGAHFSPCGRFFAACIACVLPRLEGDHELQAQRTLDSSGIATSPTQHPLSAHQVIYELRIYSLEETTFGSILASRVIRAAHCLTSIQFSPSSEHLLLAYGRRHGSLHWRRAIDEETGIHTYTIMEIYRVSNMELVRVLPSADDEVNVACFHPLAGGGLVYGTKEGKLRIFQYDGPRGAGSMGPNSLFEEKMPEVQEYALEC